MDSIVFDEMWTSVIRRKCFELREVYGGLSFDDASSKEEVKQYYEEARDYAKRHYMEKHEVLAEQKLNRYKIGAAFIIAILKARPLKKAEAKYYKSSPDKYIFNEIVALHTGLMVVRDFILLDADDPDPKKTQSEVSEDKFIGELFRNSFPIGNKRLQQWHLELYYLRREGCYNLLSLAHELEDFVTIATLEGHVRQNNGA